MRDAIRVLVLGTGQMGSGIARLVLNKQGLQLVGVYARRSQRAGLDAGPLIGLEREIGVKINHDLQAVLEASHADIVIQATCSTLAEAKDEIFAALNHGANVISIAEEMALPAATSPQFATDLDNLARERRVAVLGTGVNPGFVLDLLLITLSGVCAEVESISARRVNDLSPYGPSVLLSQGVGLSSGAFRAGLEDGSVTGHVGFIQSVLMIATALGWEIEHIEQRREAIISQVHRETAFVSIEPGQVAGCEHSVVAYRAGLPVITLVHPQQIRPELENVDTGDTLEINGKPNIRFSCVPEIPGGEATCALAVNMIPRVMSTGPGLYNMAELPAPAALMGDVRKLLQVYSHESSNG